MNSIPCPRNPNGPWGTTSYRWAHSEERNELKLFVGNSLTHLVALNQASSDSDVNAFIGGVLTEVSLRGYCYEIVGALVNALVDLGYLEPQAPCAESLSLVS